MLGPTASSPARSCDPSGRSVSFLVYDKAFEGATGHLLRLGGAIPLPQDATAAPALGRAVAVLRAGGAVGILSLIHI